MSCIATLTLHRLWRVKSEIDNEFPDSNYMGNDFVHGNIDSNHNRLSY